MRKKWDDEDFKELDQMMWSQESKQKGHQRLMIDIDKMETRTGYKHFFVYATSLTLFLIVIFVGFQFFMNDEQSPVVSVDEDEKELLEQPEVVIEEKEKLLYYGSIDSSEDYLTLAMTDVYVNYFLPVSTRTTIDILQKVDQDSLGDEFRIAFGLSLPSNTPILSYEIIDNHLHLYFDKEALLKNRGSTGTRMAAFSIYTFASNFRDQVTHFTGYGDGEPFSHYDEEFDLINVPLESKAMFYPISSDKGIYLQQQYNYSELPIEEVLTRFFGLHDMTITGEKIDLSMISIEEVEVVGETTVVHLSGNIEDVYEHNQIEKDSLKKLIIHGVGANLREQTDNEQAKIYLNKELLFDGLLSHIRINDLEEMSRHIENTSTEAKLITSARSALTYLENESWELLMRTVHPEKGLLFSPYAYVEKDQDVTFTREEVAAFATNENKYVFGHHYAKDDSVYEDTPKDFIRSILINYEYLNKKVSYKLTTFNQAYQPSGGIINNLSEAFPEGKYVEFFAPPQSEEQEHLWQALRFVFEEREDKRWYLVAIVRDIHSP